MADENVGEQFVHVVGGAFIKEAQNHVQTAIDHLSKYTAPIFNSTPEEDRDKLWDNPIFGKLSAPLSLAADHLKSAAKFHDQKQWDSASSMLIAAHKSMHEVLKNDLHMAANYNKKYPPIDDPKPLADAYDGMTKAINQWHKLFYLKKKDK